MSNQVVPILSVIAGLLCLFTPAAYADCPGADSVALGTIVANPNRPTVANPADITQYGVLELEYGYENDKAQFNEKQNQLGGLLKFAATCNLELRWNTGSFINQSDPNSSQSGIGDNWLGFQYRFHRQSPRVPTLSFSYSLKFPSASVNKGLGSGRYDHQFVFLASKDIKGFHFDFNTSVFLVGRPDGSGLDHDVQSNLGFSHPLYKKLAFTGEFYGNTKLGQVAPAYASGLWALTYAVTPRLVIDSGMDHGLTSGSPNIRRVFAGFTYSIVDVYALVRSHR
jgi:Putative MetA-pathway of phenol degradation